MNIWKHFRNHFYYYFLKNYFMEENFFSSGLPCFSSYEIALWSDWETVWTRPVDVFVFTTDKILWTDTIKLSGFSGYLKDLAVHRKSIHNPFDLKESVLSRLWSLKKFRLNSILFFGKIVELDLKLKFK